MFGQEYTWLIYLIIAEFCIVLLFLIGSYIARFFYFMKHRKDEQRIHDLKTQFQQGNYTIPKPLLNHIDLCFNALNLMDENPVPDWDTIKRDIIGQQLLPKARGFVKNRHWEKRYLLVMCYESRIENQDIKALSQLINDKTAIISFNAMKIASRLDSPELLKAILYRLAQENHAFHSIAIQEFSHSTQWNAVIKEVFKDAKDPWIKKVCYEILSHMEPNPSFFEQAKTDCYDKRVDVIIAAIRALPAIDRTQYLKLYTQLMAEKDWRIRNAVVRTLHRIEDHDSIDLLANALSDSNWWVRTNAAKSLSQLGDEGRLLLAEFKGVANIEEYEEAAYFLKIQQIRTNPHHE